MAKALRKKVRLVDVAVLIGWGVAVLIGWALILGGLTLPSTGEAGHNNGHNGDKVNQGIGSEVRDKAKGSRTTKGIGLIVRDCAKRSPKGNGRGGCVSGGGDGGGDTGGGA